MEKMNLLLNKKIKILKVKNANNFMKITIVNMDQDVNSYMNKDN